MPQRPSLSLPAASRVLVLVAAFAGWLCAGMHLAITSLAMQSAAVDLLGRDGQLNRPRYQSALRGGETYEGFTNDRALVVRWFAWYQCAFLFGAAAGGLAFGRLGDRLGRTKGMGVSILTYAVLAAAASQAHAPWQLLVLWFLACTGVGGMWPNGVALVAEAWSELSRPLAAGLIGTSANVGIFGIATLAAYVKVTPDDWQWVMIPASVPVVLGLFVLLAVPESPLWLASHRRVVVPEAGPRPMTAKTSEGIETAPSASMTASPQPPLTVPAPPPPASLLRGDLLPTVLVAIVLATVPLVGGWGSANWMVPWAAEAGEKADPPNPYLKAHVSQARALTGIVGSLLGGWIAAIVGRRRSYCLVSIAALFCAQYTFWFLRPTDAWFLAWVSALGFFSGVYFGWLPLFLPELFPTNVRSTGAGVGFNFGRILTAGTIALTGVMTTLFQGDYARIGRVTSLVFVVGALVVWAAPDTTRRRLDS